MDIKTPEERSKNMSKIKNTKTKPEMFIRSLLYSHGFRFCVNFSGLPGKPDLYFIRKEVAVFIHGCYWHRHLGCKYAYTPKSNPDFWLPKLEGNRERDKKVIRQLNDQGIRVLIIWECTVRAMMKNEIFRENVLCEIMNFINKGNDVLMNI